MFRRSSHGVRRTAELPTVRVPHRNTYFNLVCAKHGGQTIATRANGPLTVEGQCGSARRPPGQTSRSPEDGRFCTSQLEDVDVCDATSARPDLTRFCRLDGRGLEAVGGRFEPDRAVVACRGVEADQGSHRYGCEEDPRDTVVRWLATDDARSRGAGRDRGPAPHAAQGGRVLIDDDTRFDGVEVIAVDRHVWRHARCGETSM